MLTGIVPERPGPYADTRWAGSLRCASWAALFFVVVWPVLAFGAYQGWPLFVTQFVAFLGVLCWLLSELCQSRLEWRRSSADVPLALLVVFVLVQAGIGNRPLVNWALAPPAVEPALAASFPTPWFAVGSVAPWQTIESLLLFCTYLSTYVLVVGLVRRWRHLDGLVGVLLALGALVAFLGLVEYLTGTSRLWWREPRPIGRVSWSFVNPDHFGAWLTMGVSLGIGYLLSRRSMTRPVSISMVFTSAEDREAAIRIYFPFIAVSVMTLALIFTLSRGAAFSLLLTMIGLLIVLGGRGEIRWPLAVIGVLLLVTLAYGVWIGMDPLLQRWGALKDYEGRWLQVLASLPMLKDFPLFGVGLGAYKYVFAHYQTHTLRPADVYYPYAHNDLLQAVLELGLLGTAIIVIAVGAIAADLLGAHIWGRGQCRLSGEEGEAAQRHHPTSLGIGLGSLAAIVCLSIHSAVDFSARIPANGILAAVCLGMATIALHTHFSSAGTIHVGLVRWSLGRRRVVPLALALVAASLTAGMILLAFRPTWIEAALDEPASAASPSGLDAALWWDGGSVRALDARAALRLTTARTLWTSRSATPQPGPSSSLAADESRSLILGAIEDWRRTLTMIPTDPVLHERLAWAEQAAAFMDVSASEHHRAAAISHLQRALALAPEDPQIYASLSAMASAAPSPLEELALGAARAAIERDPMLLGRLAARVLPEDLTERQWLTVVPETAFGRALLAAVLEGRGRLDIAQTLYEKALEVAQPAEVPLAGWLYASLLRRRSAFREAAAVIEVAVGSDPGNPELVLTLADTRTALGDPRALEAYRQALASAERRAPRGAPAPLLFGPLPPAVQGLLAERLGADVHVQPLRYRRAFARHLIDRRHWKNALDEWDEIVSQAPHDALAHFSRGLALEGLGDASGALAAYRKTASLERPPNVRMQLATKLWDAGQYYQAIEEWRGVTAEAPNDLPARLALGRALLHVGDRMAAFLEYQKAVRIDPDNAEARQGFVRLGGLLEPPAASSPKPGPASMTSTRH